MAEFKVIGEVIESSTTEFMAESRELHSPPPFGSFAKVLSNGQESPAQTVTFNRPKDEEEDPFDAFRRNEGAFGRQYHGDSEPVPGLQPAIYAVVYQATTTSVDSSRKLRAYWKGEEQLKEEQPELSEWMLVTNFRAIIIGYSTNGRVCQFLPPQPPKLLTQVEPCTPEEVKYITSRMGFLRTLANSRSAPTEEVIAACIREASGAWSNDEEFLIAAGKELATLMKDDYDRLQAIMRRVAP